jgi:hypothetical protein
MSNFVIVLFKNNKRKRILKKFITFDKANKFYENLIEKSNDIIFDVSYENGKHCKFDLGLIQMGMKNDSPIYILDELGRNVKISLESDSMKLLEIKKYKKEEKIFDIQTGTKISVNELIKKYLKTDTLKLVSVLNNKIIIQLDEKISIFSTKTESDSFRFIDSLSNYFLKIKRFDCMFVKDVSSAQRKYLFELLNNFGIDKRKLYRKSTTHPQS